MLKYALMATTIATSLLLGTNAINAAEPEPPLVYGSQLMTQQERIEYRQKMRNAKSQEERIRIRNEHHKKMQERARAKGLKLPDKPPVAGGGMGARQKKAYDSGNNQGAGKGR